MRTPRPLVESDFEEACAQLGCKWSILRRAAREASVSKAMLANAAAAKAFIVRLPHFGDDREGYLRAQEALTALFGEHAALMEELGRDD